MAPLTVGRLRIERLVETEGPTSPRFLFPYARPEDFAPHTHWLAPHFYDPTADRLHMSIHSFIVRTPHHTVLVDTCLGNDKPRAVADWHMRSGPWLRDLQALGVAPEAVDFVLCTHLHTDHVGWNTRLADGRWVPTFPNARYVFNRTEFEHWQAADDDEQRQVLTDSVLPIVAAGQALLVEGAHELTDGIALEPTPGHTPGHCSVHLADGGAEAIITGDMMHHPIQIAEPDWCSRFCVDPPRARTTRRAFLARYADTDVRLLGTHFAAPCTGHVVAAGDGWCLHV